MKNISTWHNIIIIIFLFFINIVFGYGEDPISIDYLKQYIEQQNSDIIIDKKKELLLLQMLVSFYHPEQRMSQKLMYDLDILHESHNDLFLVLQDCFKTKTDTGKISLLLSLLHPTIDTEILLKKQQCIQYLVEHPDILALCDNALNLMKKSESSLIELLSEDMLSKDDAYIFSSNSFFKNTENSDFFMNVSLFSIPLFTWLCSIIGGYFLSSPDFVQQVTQSINQRLLKIAIQGSLGISSMVLVTLQTMLVCKNIQQHKQRVQILQNHLIELDRCFMLCSVLSALVSKIPDLKHVLLFDFFDEFFEQDDVFNEMRLRISEIKNTADDFLIPQIGSIYIAYKKLHEMKEKIALLLYIIGQLDLSVAMAKTIIEKKDNLPFCLPEFSKKSEPFFKIKDGWNPILLTHKTASEIVCNNFTLGDSHTHIAIMSGANTSGKTVITTGFLLAILLAQSLGICSASQCTLTPCKHMKILFPVRSHITRGNSKFKTEVEEMMHLIKILKECNENGDYIFVVLDEIFSGTDNHNGVIVAKEFFNNILKENLCKNSLMLVSTHYHELTKLAQEYKQCENYTVTIMRNKNGAIIRTFKLIPGIGTLQIAVDIFKEKNNETR